MRWNRGNGTLPLAIVSCTVLSMIFPAFNQAQPPAAAANGANQPPAIQAVDNAEQGAAKNAEDPPPAEQAAEKNPAIVLEPGRNLLGERIQNIAREQSSNEPSAEVKRVLGMIDETLQLLQEQEKLRGFRTDLRKKLQEKQIEFDQLPERYQAAVGEIFGIQEKMQRLAGALNLGPQNPQFQQYFQLKERAKGLVPELQLMEKKKKTLPIEIRNMMPEQNRLANSEAVGQKKIEDLVNSWTKILSVLNYLPPKDATAITQACQEKLIQYPKVTPIRVMQGLCHVHLDQPQAGIEQFKQSLVSLGQVPSKLRLPCLIGIAWASLDCGELDQAAAKIAEIRKLSKRNFELAICEARLAHLRDRATTSVSAYRRAMAISPRDPAGYRMAAMMVAQTKVRPPDIALSLAQKACDLDEFGDFRNSIALAYAQHASGNAEGRDEAIEKAYSQAGDAAREAAETMAKEIMDTE